MNQKRTIFITAAVLVMMLLASYSLAENPNLLKNADFLRIGNDGLPILAENRQSLFVPFFTTKRSGNGIGLSISRRIMTEQGGSLELEERNLPGCHVTFKLTFQ